VYDKQAYPYRSGDFNTQFHDHPATICRSNLLFKTLTTLILVGVVLIQQLLWNTTFASGTDPLGSMRPKRILTENYYLPLVWHSANPATAVIPITPPPTTPITITGTPVVTSTPRVAATALPTTTPLPEWLTHLNEIRALGGLPPVTENPEWSAANELHSRYMVKNNELTHSEAPTNRWYSETGAAAAGASNVWVSGRTEVTATTVLNNWLVAPFHGIAMIDPQLQQVGYGEYREEDGGVQLAAGIDVQRGISHTLTPTLAYPLMFPMDGAVSPFTTFLGEEFPDPLSNCPGFVPPVGAPIYLQLGTGELRPETGGHTVTVNGKLIPHCIFDETTYRHRDPNEQTVGRMILDGRDAIIILPHKPLPYGATVRVTVSVSSVTHTWEFTVAEAPPTPTPIPTATLP
jgi:uncharacterized protein YkwD